MRHPASYRGHGAAAIAVLVLTALLVGYQGAAAQPAQPASLGRLSVEGRAIKQLVLENRRGETRTVAAPNSTIELPSGDYRLQQVELTGGYTWQLRRGATEPWLTVCPEKAAKLSAGAPLRSEVQVTPGGGRLEMSYRLVDDQGREYLNSNAPAPRVAVYKEDRELVSGTFKYG